MFCTKAGQGRNHLLGGGEGRKERILLRTQFVFIHIKDWKHERCEDLLCGVLLVDSCTYLQDEIPVLLLPGKCWNLGFLSNFLFGPFDPAFMDKKITATAAVGVKVTGLGVLSWPLSFRGPYGDKEE